MTLAAHLMTISGANADSGYAEIDGINDFSFGPSRDTLETTDTADTSGAHTRMLGLKDGTIALSGDYESGDAAQALLLTQWGNGGAYWLKVLWNGSTGHKVQCIVESFDIKGNVSGKVEFSASLKMNGAFSAV